VARAEELSKECFNSFCPQANDQVRTFYLRPNGKPHSRCVPCFIEQAKDCYLRNREVRLTKVRAHYAKNIEKRRQYDRDRYEVRKESQREYLRNWRKENRARLNMHEVLRQSRMKGACEAELVDRGYIYERDNGVCHICEEHVDETAFTLDHLIPLSRGGPHMHVNLRVAHRSCNSRMGVARLPAQLLLFA